MTERMPGRQKQSAVGGGGWQRGTGRGTREGRGVGGNGALGMAV